MSETLIWVMVDSSIRIFLTSLFVGLVLRLLGKRSGELRHAAWTVVVCGMLLMPVLLIILPGLPLTLRIPERARVSAQLLRLDAPVPVAAVPMSPGVRDSFITPVSGSASYAIADSPAEPRWTWLSVLAVAYLVGLILLLIRFLGGWLGMRRIVKTSKNISVAGHGPIYESDRIAAPVATGIIFPKILLPADRGIWSKRDLRAILTHEIEHIRRRDLLFSFLARVNCCVFWFHPLAWWLDRQLSTCAEEVCDDAALRKVDSPKRYAEILVRAAQAIHQRGGRLSWTAVGVRGTGSLARRIDRILTGRIPLKSSRTRQVSLTIACAAGILLIAACRQQTMPTMTEEQQALQRVEARRLERVALLQSLRATQDRQMQAGAAAQKLTPDEALQMETVLSRRPDDLNTQLELLLFYSNFAFKAGMDVPTIVRHRRDHVLWFIQSRPADTLASTPLLFINAEAPDRFADPEGYAQGRAEWLMQVDRNKSDATVLANAAYFLQVGDKQLSENLLLQAERLHPNGPWSTRLGKLYASMILGVTALAPPPNDYSVGLIVSASTAEQRGPLAVHARQQMDSSKDFTLLLTVGQTLLRAQNVPADFDRVALALHYLQRAEPLAPSPDHVDQVRIEFNRIDSINRQVRISQLPKEGRFQAALALPDRDRFELLWDLATFNYGLGNSFDIAHYGEALTQFQQAAQYAQALASVAKKFRGDPEYGNAVFNANMMLAYVESRRGDAKATLDYMREALKAPSAIRGGDYPSLWPRVCSFLMERGHRDDVIVFLERFAQIDPLKRDDLLATAARLRSGETPDWRTL